MFFISLPFSRYILKKSATVSQPGAKLVIGSSHEMNLSNHSVLLGN